MCYNSADDPRRIKTKTIILEHFLRQGTLATLPKVSWQPTFTNTQQSRSAHHNHNKGELTHPKSRRIISFIPELSLKLGQARKKVP